MTEHKRKLIEVALPLEAINKESARERSIRHGHPSTIHLWWARRPLAACRAVLFASLVDDPSSHPDKFPTEAAQDTERLRLFGVIEDLVKWDNSDNERVLAAARAEIMRSCNGNPPTVLDPFCGGGSIPLEAQRLGLVAKAGDLNPVAVLITKALIEIPAKFAGRPPVNPSAQSPALGGWAGAHGLADDLRYYGQWLGQAAKRRLNHLYPKVKLAKEHGGGEATIIAWIWARTVRSPNPAWGGPMPLVPTFALSSKNGRSVWVQPQIDRANRTLTYEVRSGPGCPPGTVSRQGATCFVTGTAVPFEYIRSEGKAGRMGTDLIAMVAEGDSGRVYLSPTSEQVAAAKNATAAWRPDVELPFNPRNFNTPNYGLTTFADLFTQRQLAALGVFAELVDEARTLVLKHASEAGGDRSGARLQDGGLGAEAYADAICTYLAFGLSKATSRNCTLAIWESGMDRLAGAFGRQALAMTWEFAETNPLAGAGGDFVGTIASVAEVVERLAVGPPGSARQIDAAALESANRCMVSTDPPYYDNIAYADLSDFFYIWLRKTLSSIYPDLTATLVTPKANELVATPYRFGGDTTAADHHFEAGLRKSFARIKEVQLSEYPLTVFYAFKQTETGEGGSETVSTGWETMLEGLLAAGFAIDGTWPIRSETTTALKAGMNVLASSIVLVCRPRSDDAPLSTRKELVSALRGELPTALRRLQQGGIAPVDLAQAAIGPGMAVFSRYTKVIEADGSAMRIRTALGIINQLLDETLVAQEGDFDAATRWAVAWFEQFGMSSGDFGAAETLSKAKNSAVNALVEAGIVDARAGKVCLVGRDQLSSNWDPRTDPRVTVWEVTQYLIRALENGGETAAAALVGQVGGLAETARELAYRLYNISERKRWPKDALSYNGLVVAWPGIVRAAAEQPGQGVQLSLGS